MCPPILSLGPGHRPENEKIWISQFLKKKLFRGIFIDITFYNYLFLRNIGICDKIFSKIGPVSRLQSQSLDTCKMKGGENVCCSKSGLTLFSLLFMIETCLLLTYTYVYRVWLYLDEWFKSYFFLHYLYAKKCYTNWIVVPLILSLKNT